MSHVCRREAEARAQQRASAARGGASLVTPDNFDATCHRRGAFKTNNVWRHMAPLKPADGDDLVQGSDLTDDALLSSLRARHAEQCMYTYAG